MYKYVSKIASNESLKYDIYNEIEEILTKKTIYSSLFFFNGKLARKEALDVILNSELFGTSKLHLIKVFKLSDALNNSQASSSCLIL